MFLPLKFDLPDGSHKSFDAVDPKEVAYLPVVRSFEEIEEQYSRSKPDEDALASFGVKKKKVVFAHAPTSETNKGSHLFYRAATRAQQCCPSMIFQSIRQQTWATTLRILSNSDVLYDQAPPFPTAYGALSVEAGIFHMPSFSQVSPECRAFIKDQTGLDTPHIVFSNEEDLFKKTVYLASESDVRKQFGDMNYEYCKQLHDEKPVVDRFLKILEKM